MRRFVTLGFAILCCFIMVFGCDNGGSGGSGSDGSDIVSHSTLRVDKLSVSVVPGSAELVTVTATDENGDPVGCSIVCSDENVATIAHNDSVFTITGQNFGLTTVTVTSDSGEEIQIPVQVYKFDELDVDELILSFTTSFSWRWDDSGSGASNDGAYWHPTPPEGFHALGSLGINNYGNPNGNSYMFVVKAKNDTGPLPPLESPTDYLQVWNDSGTGSTDDGSIWKPIPPAGYVAMGLVAQSGYSEPSLDDVVCVREDLTTPGNVGAYIWDLMKGFPIVYFRSWQITAPDASAHENAYLAPGTFVAIVNETGSTTPPVDDDVMHVLKVKLPMLVEGPTQDFIPKLDDYDKPADETVPRMAKAMLVPFTIVNDTGYSSEEKLTDSPFYRLERYVYYKLLYHNYNQTSVQQENQVSIISGVTTTESESFWNETSISITAEAGVSFIGISGSISTTVSTSFGYENMTSIAELEQSEVTSTVYTAPGKAAALWQQYNRYILKRHNGINLETVSAWEFGLDSYTVSDYPHD
jgi:hypothetical protein